ncbi:hypothetical protein DM02DRAFT_307414 [Periconia macrospinosa]|uniref:Uncharacterized protein n=1 Tax=Periconia macrospinosa TaxID=97972 RepID=A0A2V1D1S7_9PLEO|nr:hypothetical protein DM02DRAFT_307414 [Periconia macrospinosa]
MSHTWLQKKRKGELLELAQRANVPDADSLLKDDLVAALEEHLDNNQSTYGQDLAFLEYYGRSGSPIKRERTSPEPLVATKTRRRTLLRNSTPRAPDSDQPTPERSALVPRTPRTVSQTSRRVSRTEGEVANSAQRVLDRALALPPSPAQLADVAEQSFQVAKTKATRVWERTQIDALKEFIREHASSVSAIQTLILLIEASGLQYNTLGTFALNLGRQAPGGGQTAADGSQTTTTGSNFLNQDIPLPNLWLLLTSDWWAPATLWSVTSWVLPLVFSYFFNLTLRSNTNHRSSSRQSSVDPLTFNIVKAILAYSAFAVPAASAWGPFHQDTVSVVRDNIPGQYYGMQIGAAVGVLVSLYDAALKK